MVRCAGEPHPELREVDLRLLPRRRFKTNGEWATAARWPQTAYSVAHGAVAAGIPTLTDLAEEAAIASLIETAKFNHVHPQAWLTDTLKHLDNGHRITAFGDLMLWPYAARVAD